MTTVDASRDFAKTVRLDVSHGSAIKLNSDALRDHGGLKAIEGRKVIANKKGELLSIESSPQQSIRYAKKTASAFSDILKNNPGVKYGLITLAVAAVLAATVSSFGVGVLAVPVLVGLLNLMGIAGGASIAGGLLWKGGEAALDENSKLRKLSDMGAKFHLAPVIWDQNTPPKDLINYADALIAAMPLGSDDDSFSKLAEARDKLANSPDDQDKKSLLAAIQQVQDKMSSQASSGSEVHAQADKKVEYNR